MTGFVKQVITRPQLAADAGASLIGANADQTQDDVNGEILSIVGHGADPTGVASSNAAIIAAHAVSKTLRIPDGTYLIDADMLDTFDAETLLIFEDGAKFYAASGICVNGNTCAVIGNHSIHFDHPDYSTQWATGQSYSIGDIRQFEFGRYYKCAIAHTSGTWTTDKAAGKFVAYAPYSFFSRAERDGFVYPEWFGAKADGVTLSSTPIANAFSCNSVMCSLVIDTVAGVITNQYYRLTKPLVVLNGRTLTGGPGHKYPGLLRIDGAAWGGGNLGISSEEFSSTPAATLGYSSLSNVRFQIEGMVNVLFQWVSFYLLETSNVEHVTWEFIGANTILQEAQFTGGPARISDLNIVYGDEGTVESYPLYLNMFNGGIVRNINYKNALAKKGLKIRPGRFTDISGIFIETVPKDRTQACLYIEQSAESNGRIGDIYIQNSKLADADYLGVEVYSNAGLFSPLANVEIENITLMPHDGVGSAFDRVIKINGREWTRSELQHTANNTVKIAKVSKNNFEMGTNYTKHSSGPIHSTFYFASMAIGATVSFNFSPVLKQGLAADTNQAWAGLVMVSARGASVDHSYLAFVSLKQNGAGTMAAYVYELANAGSFSLAWNAATSQWDLTNSLGESASSLTVAFINQGQSAFVQ